MTGNVWTTAMLEKTVLMDSAFVWREKNRPARKNKMKSVKAAIHSLDGSFNKIHRVFWSIQLKKVSRSNDGTRT